MEPIYWCRPKGRWALLVQRKGYDMFLRVVAIGAVFLVTTVGWVFLGGTVAFRTDNMDSKLKRQVGALWGIAHRQQAPGVACESGLAAQLASSDIQVGLELEHRKKGLRWYSTYEVDFRGTYGIRNPEPKKATRARIAFTLPDPQGDYDKVHILHGETEITPARIADGVIHFELPVPAGQTETFTVAYESSGQESWYYDFGDGKVNDFELTMTTNFTDIDFPDGSRSPDKKQSIDGGMQLIWEYENKLSGVNVGMVMPEKLNPGPWVQRVTFGAPFSLAMFFFLLFIITTLKKIEVHPVNYFFLAAAFFAYHLLLAYLVDHVDIHLSFWIASAVSIFLVVSYMRLVAGAKFALVAVGISQFIYLVLFSYTFFFEGFTGLAITIIGILTLFVIMQATGRMNWSQLFSGNGRVRHELPVSEPMVESPSSPSAET